MLSSGEDGVDDINSNWPADAHYTPPLRGTRVLSVLSQPEPMKQTLRAAFRHVTRDALFRTAYPSINTLDGQDYQKTVLCDCAKRLRFYELVKRFGIDDTLVKLCTSVVRTVHFLIWEEALMLTGVVGSTLVLLVFALAQRSLRTRRLRVSTSLLVGRNVENELLNTRSISTTSIRGLRCVSFL
jgi:hypothetical protein